MAYHYGQEQELESVVGRSVRAIAAVEDTLVLALEGGLDIVVWIDEDNLLSFRLEAEQAH